MASSSYLYDLYLKVGVSECVCVHAHEYSVFVSA